jgi:uncharacterized protein with GYD domain
MATYFMFGQYTPDAIEGISAQRTQKAEKIINENGGKLISAYALLGDNDLVLIVEFADIKAVMKTSLALNKLTGIGFSTCPALSVAEFDKLVV